ncbi:Protein lifeguard 1 [Durusdinium trenchii]|uniref:Protein lifeguard 1 n=1 Tax=Durusdinium trenchii TaxID=1381693 RepID=A0ABP0SF92_9DINO
MERTARRAEGKKRKAASTKKPARRSPRRSRSPERRRPDRPDSHEPNGHESYRAYYERAYGTPPPHPNPYAYYPPPDPRYPPPGAYGYPPPAYGYYPPAYGYPPPGYGYPPGYAYPPPSYEPPRYRLWSPDEVAEYSSAQVEACLGMERKIRLGEVAASFLENWSHSHPDVPPPLAPLRAFKYTTAGGSRGGWKRSGEFDASRMDSVFRFGFDGKNPMSNKNLVFDEVHNMLALPRWKGTYWKEPLRRLRKAVADCRGSTLVFLTGSPVQTDIDDGERLLRVLKGSEHADAGPEGWLDMHTERSLEYFPKVYPDGVPDRPLCSHLEGELVLAVDLPEEMEAKYREVESQGADTVRLRNCCNLSVHHTWALRPQKRHLMLEAAEQYARKLHEVAKTVWRSGEKAGQRFGTLASAWRPAW